VLTRKKGGGEKKGNLFPDPIQKLKQEGKRRKVFSAEKGVRGGQKKDFYVRDDQDGGVNEGKLGIR